MNKNNAWAAKAKADKANEKQTNNKKYTQRKAHDFLYAIKFIYISK